ncbi:MAG: tetratricopeptide repeat protein [Deltaproteobacteria bacterium]|nr:tetratricopeptide repeat protein [Deltaproteobacteria bacterium]
MQDSQEYGNDILTEEPENLEAIINAARILKSQGRYKEAIPLFANAVKFAAPGRRDEIKLELAAVLAWSGEFEESIRIFTEVVEANPFNMEARKGLASSYGWAGMHDKAIEEYKSILNLKPEDTEAKLGLGRVLSWKGNLDDAVEIYLSVLEKWHDNGEARLALANVLWWKGDLESSLKEADSLLLKDPENMEALRLERRLREDIGPILSFLTSKASDTDSNSLNIYKGSGYFNFGHLLRLNLDYSIFQASRLNDKGHANILSIRDSMHISKDILINPRLSLVSIGSDINNTAYLASGLSVNWNFLKNWTTIISYNSTPLVDTVQLMRNNIRLQEYAVSLLYNYRDITVAAGTAYGDYSDSNSRKDASTNIAWKITKGPDIITGYILEYRAFSKTTHSGYFNPGDFLSNKLSMTLSGKIYKERIEYDVTGAAGVQSFDAKSEYTSSLQTKLIGHINRNLSIEGGYKWSRSALESPTGYSFEEYRLGLNYVF